MKLENRRKLVRLLLEKSRKSLDAAAALVKGGRTIMFVESGSFMKTTTASVILFRIY